MASISDKAAIVGIGATKFTERGGRSAFQLACEAIKAAIDDAGLRPADIDGLAWQAPQGYSPEAITELGLLTAFGWENLRFLGIAPWGNAANAVLLAAMAVAENRAHNVVIFKTVTYGHGHTFKAPLISAKAGDGRVFYAPFGLVTVSTWGALYAQRYLHQYRADETAMGWVAVTCRNHGATNPRAIRYGQPMTIEDYLNAPYVVEPFRLPDLNLSNDGACAVVVTTAERAKDLRRRPAYIMAAAVGTGGPKTEHVTSFNRPDITISTETQVLAKEIHRQSGVTPKDIDAALIYDHMSIFVLLALEGYGFCGIGEGKDFVQGGHRISVGGTIPVNTHGGHLAEAYVQTANAIVEGVRQVRGEAANQVERAERILVISGNGLPSSALVLRR